jgi:adenosylhomocysteine nucleosidase
LVALIDAVVLISADTEWQEVCTEYMPEELLDSPLGKWFVSQPDKTDLPQEVVFFHGGWGKVAAAASAQYAIDKWQPRLLINAGTCGGFAGHIARGSIVTANKTVIYDIEERMGDQAAVIQRYSTTVSTAWLEKISLPQIQPVTIATGDQDLDPEKTLFLYQQYGAVVADWESGSIAWVAAKNAIPLIILRVVTDLVSRDAGEAYGNLDLYRAATRQYMMDVTKMVRQVIASL